MDSKLIAARERYRTPKPAPSGEELSPFSKKLQNNPYAQALATPVRQCRLTGLRLPEYFHLSFGLQQHPTTGKPWHLPKLASDADPELPQDHVFDRAGLGANKASEGQDEPDSPTPPTATDEKKPSRTVSGTHFVAQKGALRFLSQLDKKKNALRPPYRWKTSSSLDARDIVWREDMDDYVLGVLRKDLLKQLIYVAARPSGYIAKCSTYEEVKKHTQLGAALWLGDVNGSSLTGFEGDMTEADTKIPGGGDGPPAYAMLEYRGRYTPLYNLQALLGKGCLDQLRESNSRFQDKIAVIKQKRNTVPVQLALWKLLGFVVPIE